MMDADSCPPSCISPTGDGDDCDEEEELSVLPRHTKVIVTGNNRTKSMLVGLHGVVKKAVGLGGWHMLVLTNGLEVKLQRNALSVLEAPTGQEEDGDTADDFFPSRPTAEDTPKPGVVLQDSDSQPRASSRCQSSNISYEGQHSAPAELRKVDLSKLEMTALLRYLRHFNLVELGPDSSKEQLIDAVERHFMSQQLDELQVIASFVQAAKRLKTVYG